MRFYSIILILCSIYSTSAMAERAPKVRAQQVSEQTVQVTIKSYIHAKKSAKVLVTRALGVSKKFNSYLNFSVRGAQTINFTERLPSEDTQVRYKSRLLGRSGSKWSKVAKVVFKNLNKIPSNKEPGNSEEDKPEQEAPSQPKTPIEKPVNNSPEVTLPSGVIGCARSEILKVIELVNIARSENNLSGLSEHSQLAYSSQTFSASMAKTKNFSHSGWYENILDSGYQGRTAGQNIGYSSILSGQQMMKLWMNSSGHRANILNGAFTNIGVGCVVDSNNIAWWTQDFGG